MPLARMYCEGVLLTRTCPSRVGAAPTEVSGCHARVHSILRSKTVARAPSSFRVNAQNPCIHCKT